MGRAIAILAAVCRQSRLVLLAGLVGGLMLPQAAAVLRAHLTELIAALLFFAALRIDPGRMRLTRAMLKRDLVIVLALQLGLPLLIAALAALAGLAGPFTTMLILIAAAAPITGSPPIAQMLNLDGSTALRLLVLGTLLLPLTSVFPLNIAFRSAADLHLFQPAAQLAGVIFLAVGAAVLVRRTAMAGISAKADEALGGLSAILLAVFVLALMDAIQPALFSQPARLAGTLLFTCLVCFGLQVCGTLLCRRLPNRSEDAIAGAVGVVSGNRNVALFLTALPAAQIEPLMVLVGCYQIPMYLTPVLMGRFYRRVATPPSRSGQGT